MPAAICIQGVVADAAARSINQFNGGLMKYLFAALIALFLLVRPDIANAETTHCTNITSLPATISAQGVYCLKQDLSTALAAGEAISILTSNVTIDCNGYKIGGLAAGTSTTAIGIYAFQKNNIVVRNCNIRGFMVGILLSYNAVQDPVRPTGHILESNRIDQSTRAGIWIGGDASVVRNNIISGTGGNPYGENVIGIESHFNTDVIDNTVDEVVDVSETPKQVYGILNWTGKGNVIANNRIRGLSSTAGTNGIFTTYDSSRGSVRGNSVVNESGSGYGIQCISETVIASDNHVNGFDTAVSGCTVSDNISVP